MKPSKKFWGFLGMILANLPTVKSDPYLSCEGVLKEVLNAPASDRETIQKIYSDAQDRRIMAQALNAVIFIFVLGLSIFAGIEFWDSSVQ